MSASIEIGAGGSQALAGGANIAVGVATGPSGVSGAGRINLGEKGSAAPGESFQCRWKSMLALLGKQGAQPGDVAREMDAGRDPEDVRAANLNASSVPQRTSSTSTSGSTEGDQDTHATASAQTAAPSQAFGARNLRSNALRAAPPLLNPAVDVDSESAARMSASRSISGSTRRPGKQAGDETWNSSKASGSDQTTSLAAIAPVPLGSEPSLIPVKSGAHTELVSTAGGTVRTGAKSLSNGAARESAAPLPKGASTSSLPASSGNAASLTAGQSESDEAAQRLTSTAETTSIADRTGLSLKLTPASPELKGTKENVSDSDADSNAVQSIPTPASAGASAHTAPTASRSANANGSSDALALQGTHLNAAQPVAAPDVSTVSHAPLGLHGGVHPASENGLAINTTSGASSRETFAALDAEPGNGAPAWLHASAHRAEAGFNDPALGWVGVRADMGPGGVHAAIVPGSADAAQTLSSHMAGLNAHLTAEHVPVESLRLATATGSEGQSGTQQETAQNHEQGGQQQSHTGGTPVSSGSLNNSSVSAAANGVVDRDGESAQPVKSYAGLTGNGAHISVMA